MIPTVTENFYRKYILPLIDEWFKSILERNGTVRNSIENIRNFLGRWGKIYQHMEFYLIEWTIGFLIILLSISNIFSRENTKKKKKNRWNIIYWPHDFQLDGDYANFTNIFRIFPLGKEIKNLTTIPTMI